MGIFSLIGSIIGGNKQAKAADRAAQLQYEAAQKSIAESARQFDLTRADYKPYQEFGVAGVEGYGDLAGFNGAETQDAAIARLRESPLYQSLYRAGQEAVLANASATGGLRGGNTQASLYNLGEDTLASSIERQLGMYGSAIGVGSGATGAVAGFGANAAANQALLRGQGADAQAQAGLVRGGIAAQNWNNAGAFVKDSVKSIASGGFNWGSLF